MSLTSWAGSQGPLMFRQTRVALAHAPRRLRPVNIDDRGWRFGCDCAKPRQYVLGDVLAHARLLPHELAAVMAMPSNRTRQVASLVFAPFTATPMGQAP